VEELEQIFKSIGLYRTKARHVHALAQILLERYQGQVPLSEEALMSLPGVGRKTAHVVLNTLLNAPLIAVDTHVYRVSKRLGLADASDRDTVGQQLMQIIPERFIIAAHHYLIAHGRQTCQARKPQCSNCRLQQWCHFYQTL
jgi:endonuclease-3